MGVRRVLRHSAWICWKDLLEFSRSKLRLVMLVLMPLFMMMMVGFIFPTGNTISHTPVALANQDVMVNGTSLGSGLVAELEAVNNQTGMMDLRVATGYDDIKTMIQDGKVSGGIIVPPTFTSDLLAGRQGNITLMTDQSNPQTSAMIQSVVTKLIEQLGSQAAERNLNQTYNISLQEAPTVLMPYNVQVRGIVPGNPNYFEFVAPGIMAMVVMMSLMTGLPHAISYEKDMGTLDGMLVAPTSRWAIILGKVLAQSTRGMIQGFIILLMAVLLFGVVVHGSILLVILLILLTVFSFVGLGILITSFADKEETATMVMMTLMFPMMFLSGVFFPIQQMPSFMQTLASFLPLTYAASAMRKVMVLGAGISAITPEVIILAVFGIVLLTIAVPMFKRAMNK
ncbi:MAG: ABC transporter permease [Candidatus Thermoplasmatota archaeon]|nr:ABC transporter permease [Candidatus Thermoplasmatota archaeon]